MYLIRLILIVQYVRLECILLVKIGQIGLSGLTQCRYSLVVIYNVAGNYWCLKEKYIVIVYVPLYWKL